ncbi:MAG: diguanylate cyclase [Candidatus Gracilibacteria bacterium]|nr:diguanylate cyclase [Candidatus Gracilibacteria bacterium]
MKDNKNKVSFLASKTYISKLSEDYKTRGYEKIFLEKDFSFLEDLKKNIKQINERNDKIDVLFDKMTLFMQKLSTNEKLDPEVKKKFMQNSIDFFGDFIGICDSMMGTEEMIIKNIDRFRNIEKEIDTKTKSLTKHGFDREFKLIFENLMEKKHKEISVIIFDQNNLKNINECFGHEIGQESIWKFGQVLREILKVQNSKYILSNYFGGDEWFLVLIDITQGKTIEFIKKIFLELKNNTYKIKDFDIKLGSCAGISHFHPQKNMDHSLLNSKILLHITDTLLLQAKIQKNKNKSGLAYKALNISNISKDEIDKIYTNIQVLPKKLKKETLEAKKLVELFDIRKKQNEKIMKARTLGVKKILRYNIDIINEIIGHKIIDQISKTLHEAKEKITNFLPFIIEKISESIIIFLEKNHKDILIPKSEKEEIIKKILESTELKRFIRGNIDDAFSENLFNLEKKMQLKRKAN